MKLKKLFLFIFTISIIISCGTSFGKKIDFGNLEVFYSESVPKQYAENIGNYFVANNLILEKRHSIKLTSNHNSFILKLIIDEKYDRLPIAMESNLKALESDIDNAVFKDLNFSLEICDANFYPLNLKN